MELENKDPNQTAEAVPKAEKPQISSDEEEEEEKLDDDQKKLWGKIDEVLKDYHLSQF